MRRTANNNQVAYLETYKLRLCYLHGQIEQALAHADKAEAIRPSLAGQTAEYNLTVFHALSLLAASGVGAARLDEARRHIDTVRQWAEDCPVNFRHKLLLLEAELARAENRLADAMPLYEEASRAAELGRPGAMPGLANERTGSALALLGDRDKAAQALSAAVHHYKAWGAHALAARLAAEIPGILKAD